MRATAFAMTMLASSRDESAGRLGPGQHVDIEPRPALLSLRLLGFVGGYEADHSAGTAVDDGPDGRAGMIRRMTVKSFDRVDAGERARDDVGMHIACRRDGDRDAVRCRLLLLQEAQEIGPPFLVGSG